MPAWRLVIMLPGLLGVTSALVASVISLNPPVSDALMALTLLMLAVQGFIGISLIAYSIWRPFYGRERGAVGASDRDRPTA